MAELRVRVNRDDIGPAAARDQTDGGIRRCGLYSYSKLNPTGTAAVRLVAVLHWQGLGSTLTGVTH